jgi:pimeloyl-ACP methyl ester carboxylesterase
MQEPIQLLHRGNMLRGTLHIPEAAGPVPLAILFHGFSATRAENRFMFVELSRRLESRGIASARFDFSGSGESDGDFRSMTISREIEEGIGILEHLKTREFVDSKNIFLMGMSMGGVVAGMVAGRQPDDVRGLVQWAPGSVLKDDAARGRVLGVPFDLQRIPDVIDVFGLPVGKQFILDVSALDIYGESSRFSKDVLIMHGDNDPVVPLTCSKTYLECYRNGHLVVVPGAGHSFDTIECRTRFIEATCAFISRLAKGSSR